MTESDYIEYEMCFEILLVLDMYYIAFKVEYSTTIIKVTIALIYFFLLQFKCFIYLFLGEYICAMFFIFLKIILYMRVSTEFGPEKHLYFRFCILKLPHEHGF